MPPSQTHRATRRCALCNDATPMNLNLSAEPLTRGVTCVDCAPHVASFRIRHADATIEVVRGGESRAVDAKDLTEDDFDRLVVTTFSCDSCECEEVRG